jgi:hypothetical protein
MAMFRQLLAARMEHLRGRIEKLCGPVTRQGLPTTRIAKELLLKAPARSIRLMWRIGFLLTFIVALGAIGDAQTVTLTLDQDLSSKLPTGTGFTAKDSTGKIYHGHVVTHPARRLLRRGSMSLVFDDPVRSVTKDSEGIFRAGKCAW